MFAVQVDILQPDVLSMTSSGSSAASIGDSTRRSLCYRRMSSFFFHQHLFCYNVVDLNAIILADLRSVVVDHGGDKSYFSLGSICLL